MKFQSEPSLRTDRSPRYNIHCFDVMQEPHGYANFSKLMLTTPWLVYFKVSFRACLHGGGEPEVGVVTRLGGVEK